MGDSARRFLRKACEEVLATPREVTTEGDPSHFHANIESPRVAEAVMDLFEERDQLQEQLEEVLDELEYMVIQHADGQDGEVNSGFLSANADAMDVLAEAGRLELLESHGRCVKARWIPREERE